MERAIQFSPSILFLPLITYSYSLSVLLSFLPAFFPHSYLHFLSNISPFCLYISLSLSPVLCRSLVTSSVYCFSGRIPRGYFGVAFFLFTLVFGEQWITGLYIFFFWWLWLRIYHIYIFISVEGLFYRFGLIYYLYISFFLWGKDFFLCSCQ